ncbi:glycosyltransferase family 4 protein [Alkalihalobacillus sp. LMS39]|uniref:glycosyltransferase family 4 protein n=1 Tax=Alkalihalobacillus sp. LMS39 TaxID=2924032 RepID=UPI001FB39BCC|nr:glycosyltransferase family 4 protein [Alkalihalobacillus sp. LMS39]UOE94030.1 glycosyltransferase family 4 protein [Alkalihalobacillus sp. LMS39]
MKILVFSMTTILKDVSIGGSQRHLRELLVYFGKIGHTVTVLTNQREDNKEPFQLYDGVTVLPLLRFKETFPIPYDTYPFHLVHSYELIKEYTKTHDVLYIHDSQLDYQYLHEDIPTVASLKNFVYPEAMISAFHPNQSKLIVSCEYMYDCVYSTVGQLIPEMESMLTVVRNGIDLTKYKPQQTEKWREKYGIEEDDFVILFPHRPEESKGIVQALLVVDQLKRTNRLKKNIKLLIPKHVDVHISSEVAAFYFKVDQQAQELNIKEEIVYYPWVSSEEMASLYSMSNLTLCIGQFIEAFGYVQLESIACGTPVIVSNVGAQRTIVPDGYHVAKVDYGDIEATVEAILEQSKYLVDISKVHDFLDEHYNFEKNVASYEEVILSAQPLVRQKREQKKRNHYKLAPWCYISNKGIYHDYYYRYLDDSILYAFLQKQKTTPFTLNEIQAFSPHISGADVENAIVEGIIVRC